MRKPEIFCKGRIKLYCGDCLEILPTIPENSIDGACLDPPYHLQSIIKRFAKTGRTDKIRTTSGPHQRIARGFMNKTFDGGDVSFRPETWSAVLRVLKPGGYILAFSSCRTFGRMQVAMEDAGFITHPFIAWIFGQGMPKAHKVYLPGWEGWRYGAQSMSPAIEPIYFGQKPFSEKTGTKNIQKWGAGAINIDGNRIGKSKRVPVSPSRLTNGVSLSGSVDGSLRKMTGKESGFNPNIGRWPANVITDGSDPVLSACPEASYLFYEAKADANDRIGSNHPTVKPLSLIRHLVKLVCPKSGTILDPFGGTGTTAEAAFREGINTILIEYDPEYQADIRKRIRVMQEGGYARDVAKMARKPTLKDQGLFGELTHANQTRRTATKTRNGRARALRP